MELNKVKTYLIVPVGEGIGDENGASCSGMLIFNGANVFVFGGLGTRLGVESFELSSDVNLIFTLVEGNLNTQLQTQTHEVYTCSDKTAISKLEDCQKLTYDGESFNGGAPRLVKTPSTKMPFLPLQVR